ncbi:MAG: 30S ribosomal protein S17 [Candidatus Aenigmarchaeota archaeon]|nr:30S ribosomal protein S17 [Candidatus Aenigmarchaeota archaeon]
MDKKPRNIGIEVKPPKRTCEDENCPYHGSLSIRGKILEGVVVSTRPQKTAIIKREYLHYIPKYERYERRRSRIAAHNPPCIEAKVGDRVKIAECKRLSKTKAFVIIEVMK